jgi:TPR repeat protein
MSRKPLSLTYAVIALLALALCSAPAEADLAAGNAAYQAGDYTTALTELVPVAERGNVEAQAIVGRIFLDGKGVAKDRARAAKYLTAAARAGNPQAQSDLGEMYREGLGLPKDDAKALHWYRLAAEQGDSQAQYHAGLLLLDGRGGHKDVPQGMKLLTRAAENGNMTAPCASAISTPGAAASPSDGASPRLGLVRAGIPEGNATAQQKQRALPRQRRRAAECFTYSLFANRRNPASMGRVLLRKTTGTAAASRATTISPASGSQSRRSRATRRR